MPNIEPTSKRKRPNRKLLAGGAIAGGAAAYWLANRIRKPEEDSGNGTLVDWDRVRQFATSMNQGNALTLPERQLLDAEYRRLVEKAIPMVSAYTGFELDPERSAVHAFDRVDWVNANIDGFQVMLKPLEALYTDTQSPGSRSIAVNLWGGFSRNLVSTELGVLLGYLARRVLGQYDIALLGREPVEGGRLYFVEPNIQLVAKNLQVPVEQFKLWLALHETTHAFQFEAFPWVRPHFNDLLMQYLEFLKGDMQELGKGVGSLKMYADRWKQQQERGSWLEAIMTPEQHALYEEMQAMMCVIEGYSNHVMNAIGQKAMPGFEEIKRKFEQRQGQRSKAEQLFARFTGLNLKMEQYRLGQEFVDQVVAERGHPFAKRIWDGPEYLPTLVEIRDPAAWIIRIEQASSS